MADDALKGRHRTRTRQRDRSLVLDGWHNQDIHVQRTQHLLRDAPEKQFHQPGTAVGSDDQQIGSHLFDGARDHLESPAFLDTPRPSTAAKPFVIRNAASSSTAFWR